MGLEADAGTILKIAGDAGGCNDDSDANKDGNMGIEGDAGGGDGDYDGESGTTWTSTSVVQAPAATPGMYRKSRGALVIAARLRPRTRGHLEESAVPLEPGDNNREVRDADAQHGSDEPHEVNGPADDDAMSLRAPRSDLVSEGCVKHHGPDTRPR